jgi:uncharacterized Tic20 family protein
MDPEPAIATSTKDERLWAMFAHLSAFLGHFIPFGNIIGPLVIWMIKKDTSPLIDDQGKESTNAQISLSIYLIVSGILCWILIGFLLLPVVYVTGVILVIIAAVKANEGVRYRYPFIIRLIK